MSFDSIQEYCSIVIVLPSIYASREVKEDQNINVKLLQQRKFQ